MRFQLERILFFIVMLVSRIFPRSLFLSSGRSLGSLAYYLDSRHRRVAVKNFCSAFPERQQNAVPVIKSVYRHFGGYLFDILNLLSRFDAERIRSYNIDGLDHLAAAYAKQKGVIVFTAHYGVWEIMALAQALKGFQMGVIARPLDNPYLEQLLYEFRTKTGNFVIDKKQAFRASLKALKEGKGIAILIDQNVTTEDRVFVDFFGVPASTTPALALLKLKSGAELIPAFSFPVPGNRYQFVYGAPLDIPLTGDRKMDVLNITQQCTKVIQRQIVADPRYWLWMHRRWKTRPAEKDQSISPMPVETTAGDAAS